MIHIKVEWIKCARGHNVEALSINDTRITTTKCCGSWTTIKTFNVPVENLINVIEEIKK